MPLQVLNGPTIAAGDSLSDGLDCTSGRIVRLTMPADWTPANVSFQISSDGVFYNDVINTSGQEIMMPVVAGSAVLVASLGDNLDGVAFLKIRSGSRSHPVIQAAQRAFAVAVQVSS